MNANALRAELAALANPEKAKVLAGFFKTGPGEYGEGDRFLGIAVPLQRIVARKYAALPLSAIDTLLKSPIHEERATALMVLVRQYEKGTAAEKKARFDFYLERLDRVNNWDLVDASAAQIVGAQLLTTNRALLRRMATSANLWERRVAIISTYAFIRAGELADTGAS